MGRFGHLLFAQLGLALALSGTPAFAQTATPIPSTFGRHSHNDYLQAQPLATALGLHFESVEADLWLALRGRIKVAHVPWKTTGSLKELYLDPLQKLVDQKGSVYGTGEPLLLWLDIKDFRPSIIDDLTTLLKTYPMVGGAVKIVLTGQWEALKKRLLKEHPELKLYRDSNHYSEKDPQSDGAWTWYSLNWRNHFKWNGEGQMPTDELIHLNALVTQIHAKGRKVRFFAAPETEEAWSHQIRAGVDLVGSDDLPRLSQFFGRSLISPTRTQH